MEDVGKETDDLSFVVVEEVGGRFPYAYPYFPTGDNGPDNCARQAEQHDDEQDDGSYPPLRHALLPPFVGSQPFRFGIFSIAGKGAYVKY